MSVFIDMIKSIDDRIESRLERLGIHMVSDKLVVFYVALICYLLLFGCIVVSAWETYH